MTGCIGPLLAPNTRQDAMPLDTKVSPALNKVNLGFHLDRAR
jgi:hypothetical protein